MRHIVLTLIAALVVVGANAQASLKPVNASPVEFYRGLVLPAYESAIVAGLDCKGDLLKEAVDYVISGAQTVEIDQSGGQPAFHLVANYAPFDNGIEMDPAQRDEVWVTTSADGKTVVSAKISEFILSTTNVGTLVHPHIVSVWRPNGTSSCSR